MTVTRFTLLDALPLTVTEWDALARGRFFLTRTWLDTWWRHYRDDPGRRLELYVLVVRDDAGSVVGIAPWYLERTRSGAGTLRFLGDGEVCSDYLSLLSRPGSEAAVADAIASWLVERPTAPGIPPEGDTVGTWSRIVADGIERHDPGMHQLFSRLADLGCVVRRRPGLNCWVIDDLPSTFEAFMERLSKKRRAQTRRVLARLEDAERLQVRHVQDAASLDRGWSILVDLHQRRWRSLGQPGCFASERFTAFHRDVTGHLLARGELSLCWLEDRGRPVAVEYGFVVDGTLFNYQSGLDPAAADLEPGRLMQAIVTRRAIDRGLSRFDYLRGDEEYKAHWRALPRPTWDVRVAAPRPGPRLAEAVRAVAGHLKHWGSTESRAPWQPWSPEAAE